MCSSQVRRGAGRPLGSAVRAENPSTGSSRAALACKKLDDGMAARGTAKPLRSVSWQRLRVLDERSLLLPERDEASRAC